MTNPTATQPNAAVGKTIQSFVFLGALYMLERLLCARHDCDGTCVDRQQMIYQVMAPLQDLYGSAATGGIALHWDGGLVLSVSDPMMLSLEAPEIFRSLENIRREGFNVVYQEGGQA
jgi:hypothetical protein